MARPERRLLPIEYEVGILGRTAKESEEASADTDGTVCVRVSAEVWKCEVCGWRWGLADAGAKPPARCANPECQTRRWNAAEKLPASTDLRQVAEQLIRRAAIRHARADERRREPLLR
jgi:hypothetical protein